MNALLQWFASPDWSQIVTALLHSLWQGALIALVLAVGLRRIVDPALRYRCSSAALSGVMAAGIVTWAVLAASSRPASDLSQSLLTGQQPKANFSAPAMSDNDDKLILTAALKNSEKSFHWNAWLAFAWLVGAGLMLARTGARVAGAGQLRRSCRPVDDVQVEKLLGEARRALGLARRVRVGVTHRLTSPAVVGVFVPMLVLPLSLLSTLSPEQIRFVLLHELAHVRRGDYLANLFQFFAESLLFFNPAVWWISHQMRREREACCDALAIRLSGAPADYARTLVQVAESVLNSPVTAAAAFGTQRGSSSLIERVERMLVPGYQPSLRLTWRAMLAALALGSTLLVLSAVGTRTTVAAILTPEPSAARGADGQSGSKSNIVYEIKKDVETEQKLRDGRDRLADRAKFETALGMKAEELKQGTNGASLKQSQAEELQTRWFRIDSNTFLNNLSERVGPRVTNDYITLMTGLREFCERGGVDLGKPKSIFYNDKAGIIVVRATSKDLDIIETAISELIDQQPMVSSATNVDLRPEAPPQLFVRNFKIKPDAFFTNLRKQVGLSTNTNVERETVGLLKIFADAGVEFQPPKALYLNQNGIILVRATSNDLNTVETIVTKLNYSPPQVHLKTRFIELPDTLARALMAEYASIATNDIVVGGFSAVLTPEQVKRLLARCGSASDVNIMSLMELTTFSGRQGEVQMVDVMTLVKGLNPEALTPPGVTNQMFYQTEQMFLGPIINLLPHVSADESAVQLSVVPRLTEFLRYEGPTNSVAVYMKGKKRPATAVIPRPHYRTREMAVSATLPDEQTLLLGGMPWTETITRIDGTIETRTTEDAARRQLFVIVTPTLITPAGNRLHADVSPMAQQAGN